MTAAKKPLDPHPPLWVDGEFREPMYRTRFLLASGEIADVITARDDSRLREILVNELKESIVGSTRMEFVGYSMLEKAKRTVTRG